MNSKLFIVGCIAASASKALAIMGMGDVVIVASNPAQELLWASEELPKWIEMIDKAKQQVDRAQELIDVAGHPEKFANQLLQANTPALKATQLANAIQSGRDVVDFTERSWTLFKKDARELGDALRVEQTFEVLGKTVSRDANRYLPLAKEKALRTRLNEVLKSKHDVDTQELQYQEAALRALGAASTQAEIAFHQAGLAASKQRMDAIGDRVKQAEAELQSFMGDVVLESRKSAEAAKELGEAALLETAARINSAADATGERTNSSM